MPGSLEYQSIQRLDHSDNAIDNVNYAQEIFDHERKSCQNSINLTCLTPHPTVPERLESRDSGVSDTEGTDIDSELSTGTSGFSNYADLSNGSCSDGCHTNTLSLEYIKENAISLGEYIILNDNKNCKHGPAMKKIVLIIEEKHKTTFKNMIYRLDLQNTTNTIECFLSILQRLFSDNTINWGRIVTAYAFAYSLSKHIQQTTQDKAAQLEIGRVCGQFIADEKSCWIKNNGGWEGMEEFFKDPHPMDACVWKGLLYTFLGLGALATTVTLAR